MVKRLLKLLLGVAALLLAVAWLTRRPLPSATHTTNSTPLAEDGRSTTLGRGLEPLLAAHPGLTGIYPLPDGRDAFVARAALADAAQQSIDAQYYIWRDDISGRLLLQSLRRAADRGVRVRLLLDDNNTKGLDIVLTGLDAHSRIEVRLFNPLMHRHARVLDFLSDFSRVNRRMHNKSFTVDGQVTVVGGRNVGDEYFGAGDGMLFADLDVLAAGAVVQEVSADFEHYWVSASTYPLADIVTDGVAHDVGSTPAQDGATQAYLQALSRSTLVAQLRDHTLTMDWAPAKLISDDPAKGLGQVQSDGLVLTHLGDALGAAQRELTIVSPYFVPGRAGVDSLVALAQRGVAVTVLTNALSATDVGAVHAGYARYRTDLLRGGVKLYELKRHATVVENATGGFSGSSGASLHAKTFAVDEQRLFVGSFNMDPRSAHLNTEMGLLIDSPSLAGQLTRGLAAHQRTHAYAVTLTENGLLWTTQDGSQVLTHDTEPQTSLLRRLTVTVLSWLPIEWML